MSFVGDVLLGNPGEECVQCGKLTACLCISQFFVHMFISLSW